MSLQGHGFDLSIYYNEPSKEADTSPRRRPRPAPERAPQAGDDTSPTPPPKSPPIPEFPSGAFNLSIFYSEKPKRANPPRQRPRLRTRSAPEPERVPVRPRPRAVSVHGLSPVRVVPLLALPRFLLAWFLTSLLCSHRRPTSTGTRPRRAPSPCCRPGPSCRPGASRGPRATRSSPSSRPLLPARLPSRCSARLGTRSPARLLRGRCRPPAWPPRCAPSSPSPRPLPACRSGASAPSSALALSPSRRPSARAPSRHRRLARRPPPRPVPPAGRSLAARTRCSRSAAWSLGDGRRRPTSSTCTLSLSRRYWFSPAPEACLSKHQTVVVRSRDS